MQKKMKDPFGRTKIVVRQLPPTLSHSDFFSQIDSRFNGRYSWSSFRPGKISYKHQRNARAYIKFNSAEDVFEFAEFFNGHVFVNEKGAQYKAIVEYAPSQRIPRPCPKKDAREGTIYKDHDYLDFLKLIAKPAEHLPSAEIQLERKEAEQAGAAKESPIVTPLMEFVRKKRAAGTGSQGKSAGGKLSRRGTATLNKSSSTPTKRSSEKKKYIMKESAKGSQRKEKPAYIVASRREDQPTTSSGKEISEIENVPGIEGSVSGIPLTIDSGKKILLLKGKERGTTQASEGVPQQQDATFTAGSSPSITAPKQKQRREAGGRLIRNLLLSNDARQSASAVQQKNSNFGVENEKRPPRSNSRPSDQNSRNKSNATISDGPSKKPLEDEFIKKDSKSLVGFSEKADKRTRNRDRADHGVWAPLRRSDANEDSSSSMLQCPAEGSGKQYGRRVAGHSIKDDASSTSSDSRSSRRGGGVSGHVYNEKQVWVQKPSSGS